MAQILIFPLNTKEKSTKNSLSMQPSAETIRLNKQMEKEIKNWIEGCRKGVRSAQLKLYEHYARMLFASCYRILANTEEAEEAMQDSFLKIFTHLEQYHEEMSFEAWVRRIAIHTAIDYVRQRSEELELLTDNLPDLAEEEEEEEPRYTVDQVRHAMEQLPNGYRVVLSLYLFEGYDMEEIAQILHVKPASVRSQYLRGKRKLIEGIKRQ